MAINQYTQKQQAGGGDMIADAAGNLYVISAFRQVYKVNIQSKVAYLAYRNKRTAYYFYYQWRR